MTRDNEWRALCDWVASDDPPPGERLGWPVAARVILAASVALWVAGYFVVEAMT